MAVDTNQLAALGNALVNASLATQNAPIPELVQMWQEAILKARQEIPDAPLRTATMNFQWTGGGQALELENMDPIILEVPYPCRILWAHMRAGSAVGDPMPVSATISVQFSQFETFGASTPLHSVGTIPTLATQSSSDCDISDWHQELTTGDTLIAVMETYTGVATWVSLILLIRATDVSTLGQDVMVDADGNPIIDTGGNQVVAR